MVARVLIVDDSGFFRRRLNEILGSHPGIEVVGMAADGQEAIDLTLRLKPDVITMDIEMPVMDGITAVRRIMALRPTPILMFSSLTTEGASATFDALDAGAADYLPKRLEDISADRAQATQELCTRVRVLAARGARSAPVLPAVRDVVQAASARVAGAARYRVVAIGASTGGPVALQQVLMNLPKTFPLPILLIQHMPATFTGPYALRLAQTCRIAVREATDGDVLRPGEALLAPGGKQLTVELHGSQAVVRLREPRPDETYRPCVDIAFASLSQVYAAKVLALVLTGMGADGREGARQLKQAGASVWAQDEKTCVVYGMPAAVAEAGLADRILPLPAIGPGLASEVV